MEVYDHVTLRGGPKDGEVVLAHNKTTELEVFINGVDKVTKEGPVKYIYKRTASNSAEYVGYEQ